MTDQDLLPAARAAYDAASADGPAGDGADFELNREKWISVARAVIGMAPPDPKWPLRARVWVRMEDGRPKEKVLEIEGVIGGTHMTCRHTQSLEVADHDVPGLPEHYSNLEMPDDVSPYARGISERHGLDGLHSEAKRLIHKITVASSLYRDGTVKRILAKADGAEKRVKEAVRQDNGIWLARELDALQAIVVEAQRLADPNGRASLVLHVDEDKWDRYSSYAAYLDFGRRNAE